jgi:hypothetical protein
MMEHLLTKMKAKMKANLGRMETQMDTQGDGESLQEVATAIGQVTHRIIPT